MDNKINFQMTLLHWQFTRMRQRQRPQTIGNRPFPPLKFLWISWLCNSSSPIHLHFHFIPMSFLNLSICLCFSIWTCCRCCIACTVHVVYSGWASGDEETVKKLSFIELNLLISIVHHIADKVIQRRYANGVYGHKHGMDVYVLK